MTVKGPELEDMVDPLEAVVAVSAPDTMPASWDEAKSYQGFGIQFEVEAAGTHSVEISVTVAGRVTTASVPLLVRVIDPTS